MSTDEPWPGRLEKGERRRRERTLSDARAMKKRQQRARKAAKVSRAARRKQR